MKMKKLICKLLGHKWQAGPSVPGLLLYSTPFGERMERETKFRTWSCKRCGYYEPKEDR